MRTIESQVDGDVGDAGDGGGDGGIDVGEIGDEILWNLVVDLKR